MKPVIAEYDSADTPSGFLRWSRPPPSGRISLKLWRILKGIADKKRGFWYHLAVWALLPGLSLACGLYYICIVLLMVYHPTSALQLSVEKLNLNQHVWCGLITLQSAARHCVRGTIDLRIRNRMWTGMTIQSVYAPLYYYIPNTRYLGLRESIGRLEVESLVVKPMSDDLYTLPAYLVATGFVNPSGSNLTAQVFFSIDALGFHTVDAFDFGLHRIPSYTLWTPPSAANDSPSEWLLDRWSSQLFLIGPLLHIFHPALETPASIPWVCSESFFYFTIHFRSYSIANLECNHSPIECVAFVREPVCQVAQFWRRIQPPSRLNSFCEPRNRLHNIKRISGEGVIFSEHIWWWFVNRICTEMIILTMAFDY